MYNFEDYLLQEELNEILNGESLNEAIQIPAKFQDVARNIADKFSKQKSDAVAKIKEKYHGKTLKEIFKETHKTISDSVVGEFAKDVTPVITNKLKPIAKKVGEWSTIGLILLFIVDWLVPFGIGDKWYNVFEWKLGIAILVSLVIYILARVTKKKDK